MWHVHYSVIIAPEEDNTDAYWEQHSCLSGIWQPNQNIKHVPKLKRLTSIAANVVCDASDCLLILVSFSQNKNDAANANYIHYIMQFLILGNQRYGFTSWET